jgi:hypothetical protein
LGKRKKEGKTTASLFDRARNELFGQIRHCGVLQATQDQRDAWFDETIQYLAKRYPGVSEEQLALLKELGQRYCEPVIQHGDRVSQSEGSGS